MDYSDFLRSKAIVDHPTGFQVKDSELNPNLFPFQSALVKWALARGRAALFEGTGLGKTIQQLDWADKVVRHTNGSVLLQAPLAVAEQTRAEGEKFGIESRVVASQAEVRKGINITNYEKLHKFDPSSFDGVVLDESSILKSFSGAVRNQIINAFRDTKYRLSCTATPAPNDYTELGNQSEFLSILTHSEMRSTFFVNDTKDTGAPWRLKGHVQENVFWRWLASWGAVVNMPSDLGFDDAGYVLPPLTYHEHIIKAGKGAKRNGFFLEEVGDQNSRRRVRKESIGPRCEAAAELINKDPDDWLVWCGLNDEGLLLTKLIDGAVEVAGRHSDEHRAEAISGFVNGSLHRLVTKPDIAGWGLNLQRCYKSAFVGLNDSWESMFQAVRRIWRFGQTEPCEIHIFVEEREGPVLQNIKRKDEQARQMAEAMSHQMKDLVRREVYKAAKESDDYDPQQRMRIPKWLGK